jgi:glycosyltransferase involved in cell wall biosynthesis
MKKVAFIVQRCGLEVNGGSEALCLQVAQRMSKYWEIDILTTCAQDNYMTWENQYSPGVERINGLRIHRFPVDHPRVVELFNRKSDVIRSQMPKVSLSDQENWMRLQGPFSSSLLKFITDQKNNFDSFVFFTYLYATTYFGLPIVKEKAFMVPAGHDEWPIYLSMWDALFKMPRGFMFLTPEEKSFLQSRFPGAALDGPVSGIGVDMDRSCDSNRFAKCYGIDNPFLLYMGRIDPSKGCTELFDFFRIFKKRSHSNMKLVLLGKPAMTIPDDPDIISLGYVDEQTKFDALAACEWLVNPSHYESLSIVLLEAWSVETPVLVTAKADVLVGQCRRSNGGLWYHDLEEFAHIVLNTGKETRCALGRQGKTFVAKHYGWQRIEEKYLTLLEGAAKSVSVAP